MIIPMIETTAIIPMMIMISMMDVKQTNKQTHHKREKAQEKSFEDEQTPDRQRVNLIRSTV